MEHAADGTGGENGDEDEMGWGRGGMAGGKGHAPRSSSLGLSPSGTHLLDGEGSAR